MALLTLDLLNQETLAKSSDQNQSLLTNMYLEQDESTSGVKGEYRVIAYPTFGLSTFSDTGQSQVRALFEHNEVLYTVVGNKFYYTNSAGTLSSLIGTLNTSTGFAKIVAITGGGDTNNQIIIIDGTNGYHYNVTTGTATFPITDVDFPQTCTDITAQDDYVIVLKNGSISFYICNLSQGLVWSALDFASKFRKADRVTAIASIKGELWVMGSKTIEVWVNSGNVDFPFERRSDVFIEEGCAAKRSVVIAANRLIYLSKSETGGYKISMIEGYEPKKLSTKAIDYQINKLTTVSDCLAYAYYKDGTEFIDFTFPTESKTFTLNLGNGTWTSKESYVSSTYGRFLGNCHAFCFNKHLIGDYNSGKIYELSNTTYTEDSVPIRRRFVSPPIYQQGKRIFMERLQIDVQTNVGSGKTLTLEMSTDRGNTWETIDTYTVPTTGDGTIYTTSLGSAYCFLFRITTTDDFNFTLLGFQAFINVGSH